MARDLLETQEGDDGTRQDHFAGSSGAGGERLPDENKVEYADAGVAYEMSLAEFGAQALLGSWLGRAYLGAVGAIVVLEQGNAIDALQLPQHLVTLFHREAEAVAPA